MHADGMTKFLVAAATSTILAGCQPENPAKAPEPPAAPTKAPAAAPAMDPGKFLNQPLVSHIFTADPSAHVFNGRIYVYPSHDFEAGIPQDDLGSHFGMVDYHVLSMDRVGAKVTDHGVALDIKDVP
jgi:hypothetical protein